MQVCTSLQTDNHASTTPLSFYRPDALPAAQPTTSKHWRQTQYRISQRKPSLRRYKNLIILLNYYITPVWQPLFQDNLGNRYQKGKTSLDLNDAKEDGVLGRSGIRWTICKQSAPHSRQITTPTPHQTSFKNLKITNIVWKTQLTFSIEAIHHWLNYVKLVFNGKIDKVGIKKNMIWWSKLLIVFEK